MLKIIKVLGVSFFVINFQPIHAQGVENVPAGVATSVVDWQDANAGYQDPQFGEFVYNEPSTETKLEMLKLLSKDTPSILVFMQAISMGLGIDEILQASVQYSPEKSRDLARSAISLLPLLNHPPVDEYVSYDLPRLEAYTRSLSDEKKARFNVVEGQRHSVHAVVERFFNERLTLNSSPDWYNGQTHIMATAKELRSLHYQTNNNNAQWYRSKSQSSNQGRPVFISLYEEGHTVLIDGYERVRRALKNDPERLFPVVFIFNRSNERSIDTLGYPATLAGVINAYQEKSIMITPTPEWQRGEYHINAKLSEAYNVFDIPSKEDFEPEVWQKLLDEAQTYNVDQTSFVVTVLSGVDETNVVEKESKISRRFIPNKNNSKGLQFASLDNPRDEARFKYVTPSQGLDLSLKAVLAKGAILNRPDLLAALNALGVDSVPVSFYYLDSARVKPYVRGPRSLLQSVIGLGLPSVTPPSGGIAPLQPASPPGL